MSSMKSSSIMGGGASPPPIASRACRMSSAGGVAGDFSANWAAPVLAGFRSASRS